MTKKELVAEIVNKGLAETKKDANKLVEGIVEIITLGIVNNDPLAIKGFGKFEIINVKPKLARNPQTGERVQIPARNKLKFVPSQEIKDAIN